MKATSSLLFFVSVLFFLNIEKPANGIENLQIKQYWEEVKELKARDLPASVLSKVEDIYNIALENNIESEILKSIVYKLKYISILEENGFVNAINKLEKEIEIQDGATKSLLHYLLANMYLQYYNANSFTIDQRTVIYSSSDISDDIKTWHKDLFKYKVINNLSHSFDKVFLNYSTSDFPDIFRIADKDYQISDKVFPNAYDFLIFSGINLLSNSGMQRFSGLPDSDNFNNKDLISDARHFTGLDLETDTTSFYDACFLFYQKWLSNRLNDADNKLALVYADIHRLTFMKNNLMVSSKNEKWLHQLELLRSEHINTPAVSQINYELAKFYNTNAGHFSDNDSVAKKIKQYRLKAHQLLTEVADNYPESLFYPECKNLKKEIARKSFSFKTEKINSSGKKVPLKLNYRNIDSLYYTIIKIDYEDYKKFQHKNYDEYYFASLFSQSEIIFKNKLLNLTNENLFNPHSTEILLDEFDLGFYKIIFNLKTEFTVDTNYMSMGNIFVSNLSITSRSSQFNNKKEYFILNRESGKPVKNAVVNFYSFEYDYSLRRRVERKIHTSKTDENGYVKFDKKSDRGFYNARVEVRYDDDFILKQSQIYIREKPQPRIHTRTELYTDRAIYRPGQTVYFKGIVFDTDGENSELRKNHTTEVNFYDVNSQKISSLDVKTNDFGSFSGSFSIPQGVLTGNFRIVSERGIRSIKVEEYKIPNFKLLLEPSSVEYKLGDTVKIKGTAQTYSGVPLTNAKGRFTIERKVFNRIISPFFFSMPASQSQEVDFGSIEIDDNGNFLIEFKTEETDIRHLIHFLYIIKADVTDINGETQSASLSINVANQALFISAEIDKYINKDNSKSGIEIKTTNISGDFIPAEVDVQIYKLKTPQLILRDKKWNPTDQKLYSKKEWYKLTKGLEYNNESDISNWQTEKVVVHEKIQTSETQNIDYSVINSLQAGAYRVVLSAYDKYGTEITETIEFTVYSAKSKKMPYAATYFFSAPRDTYSPGDTYEFYIGSSYKNVNLVFETSLKGELSSREFITINNEIKTIKIPVKQEHRGGFEVNLFFVREGRIYNFNRNIEVDFPCKKLEIELLTFRDKTLPGSEEEWRIRITDINDNPVKVEFLSGMYDAALDVFASNTWNLNYLPTYRLNSLWTGESFVRIGSNSVTRNLFPQYLRSKIKIPAINFYNFHYLTPAWGRRYSRAKLGSAENEGIMPEKSFAETEEVSEMTADGEVYEDVEDSFLPAQVRTDFNETAFFFPSIVTDENGELLLSFKMPENLTQWKFMGLAHTKTMQTGRITDYTITQKELMLTPNLPRFFRENDSISISSVIRNISEEHISGVSKIEFFNPINLECLNDKLLVYDEQSEKSFSVNENNSTSVSYQLFVPEGLNMVGVRIYATSQKHSDGEEHIVPVLSNRILLTETMPVNVKEKGVHSFKMERLLHSDSISGIKHHNLSLEFTSNPTWLAVQSLPYLMEYPYNSAENIFSRLYSNKLASYIANSDPKIKRVFEIWRNSPDSKSLMSSLEKNPELKSIVLEETPWLLQAKDESERKKRIALLFDINKINNEINIAINQLAELQKYNGGWPWFEGMPENHYISQHIVSGFGKLNKIKALDIADNTKLYGMVENAVAFIDGELVDGYNRLKARCDEKCLERDNIGYLQIHYLFTRSFFNEYFSIDNNTKEAYDYYFNQAVKYRSNKSFYMQAMIAIALHRAGNVNEAEAIIKSLKEYAIHHEELGTYWKFDRGFFWYQAPIETQAMLIEAFEEITGDYEYINEMKIWLLKQRQTQDWKTTKATVEAIYALLLRGTELLSDDEIPVIKLGSVIVDADSEDDIKTEAGTGYFKKSWTAAEFDSDMGHVSIEKTDDGLSWGALYWQYFQDLDKVTSFTETPLQIEKKLFARNSDDGSNTLVPIDENTSIKVGDRITVRIVIQTDRDMEYVHLKDMRASGLEPAVHSSGYTYSHGLGYYRSIKDASISFFINYLRKGTYVFEYELIATQKGNFSTGITKIQSMYAPEFTSFSEGGRISVGK